jgi:hypothetical protein
MAAVVYDRNAKPGQNVMVNDSEVRHHGSHDGCLGAWVKRRGRDPLGLEALGDRLLTIDDLGLLPDDGYRYELDEGALVVSAASASHHNIAATRLAAYLTNACPADMIVIAGEGVMISPIHYRIPDLVVVRPDTIGSHHVERAVDQYLVPVPRR